ncbi:MAG: hypothetical protein Q6J33_00570, partial [Gloeomargarita sp. DG_2_bins_126]
MTRFTPRRWHHDNFSLSGQLPTQINANRDWPAVQRNIKRIEMGIAVCLTGLGWVHLNFSVLLAGCGEIPYSVKVENVTIAQTCGFLRSVLMSIHW